MSSYEAYEYERGPFAGQGEYETFETGYETYESEDEQFLGNILSTIGKLVGPQLPGIAKGFLGAMTSGGASPLTPTQEMELTSELLELTSEEELEEFLGNLLKGVAKSVGGYISSPQGKVLGGVLKDVAKKALPVVGGALGSFIPIPGVGTAMGTQLGSLASGLLEMELEGMTREQAEFESARRVVRLAATSAEHAAKAPRGAPPAKVARAAITQAARQHAPGLLRGAGAAGGSPPRGRAGAGASPRRGQAGAGGGPRGQQQRRPRPGGQATPGGRQPLGAAAFRDADAGTGVPGYARGNGASEPEPDEPSAAEPTYGAPEWSDPEPNGDAPEGAGPRDRSGRWIRRGRKIVVMGA